MPAGRCGSGRRRCRGRSGRRCGCSWRRSVLLVYASYWFVMEPPQAHAFYVLAPIAFMFTAFWWTFVDSPRARQIAAGVLALNVAFHAGLAWAQAPELSLYKQSRGRRDGGAAEGAGDVRAPPRLRGRRRADGAVAIRRAPTIRRATFRCWRRRIGRGRGRSLHWTITVHNRSAVVAFRDPLYVATYLDDRDAVVDRASRAAQGHLPAGRDADHRAERRLRRSAVHEGADADRRGRSAAANSELRLGVQTPGRNSGLSCGSIGGAPSNG